MRFQTSFHVGSTRGCRGNGKLIIEMKPTSLSYHKGQLCGSPPAATFLPFLNTVLECVCIYFLFLLINPYKRTQEKDLLCTREVQSGAIIECKCHRNCSRLPERNQTLSCLSTYFKAFRPSHSKSTNKSIFQVRSGVVMTSHTWDAVNEH